VNATNLYGRGDNYHPEYSHVVAALIRRFHEAKMSGLKNVVVWGTGTRGANSSTSTILRTPASI